MAEFGYDLLKIYYLCGSNNSKNLKSDDTSPEMKRLHSDNASPEIITLEMSDGGEGMFDAFLSAIL